ncbi:hypothetical protein CRENPOLYSF1_10038 [Crenothrix polyspora]|uniref:Uncharacterized protein n=1 Tax=Crenothrix polyspora TaxID=360316 RepID=A0A1R4GYK7_9GAMM|nr:hypothetical protein CRENPOLYSF1_10038 [Crenothrix polyspora]
MRNGNFLGNAYKKLEQVDASTRSVRAKLVFSSIQLILCASLSYEIDVNLDKKRKLN